MTILRRLLYLAISIPVIIILIWLFAVPEDLIKTIVEDSISDSGKPAINASLKGISKGIFFTVHADTLEIEIDKTKALKITDISGRINLAHLLKMQLAFSVKGKIGTGIIEGIFKLPETGALKIENVELGSIPYLISTGLKASGLISATLNLKNNIIDIIFKIPDVDIQSSIKGVPLPVNSFHKVQGTLYLKKNRVKVKSISLEADRGYARLKGDITGGMMNLSLEIMPSRGELSSLESTLISRYQVSPGYYLIPIKGPLL